MSKQSMREETERLVKEAMERKTVAVKQGKTRIDAICGVSAARQIASQQRQDRFGLPTRVRNAETNKRRCDEI